MKSRQEKLKLFILLSQALGLLVTLLCSFIGALYIFDGEWLFAFPISIIFVVAMYYLVIFFCKEKENRRKKGYPPIFYYLFGVYAIMSIILSFFVLHFYNVEINEKEEIQQAGLNKINGVEMIYKSYDSEYKAFVNTLEANLNEKLTNYKINNDIPTKEELKAPPYRLSDADITSAINALSISQRVSYIKETRIDGFLNNRKKTLTRDNSNNDTSYVKFLDDQEEIINEWDRLSIGKSMSDLNERIVKDYESLNDYLTNKTANNYKIEFDTSNYLGETLMNKPFDLAAKHMGPMTLLILIFFQILILLPYFLTRGRNYGN